MSDHLAGLRLKRLTGKPWVAHFSDPWADNPYRRQLPLLKWANRRLEGNVIEAVDRVVFTSEQTLDLVMAKYPPSWRSKGYVLPHAFDRSLYSGGVSVSDDIVIRHIGHFYPPRSPMPLLDGIELLRQTEPELVRRLRVELVGGMHSASQPEALPPCVSLRQAVDYTESLDLMSSAHVLLVIDAPSDLSVFLPSKLIDYVGSGRPILAITPPGATADLLNQLGGFVVRPDEPAAIASALGKILRDSSILNTQRWGHADVRDRYEGTVVAKQFDDLLEEVRLL
jgi:glycosyltransferase involved in cell wall biosynthesis